MKKYDKHKIINRALNLIVLIITIASSILILYFKNIIILFIDICLWIIIINVNKRYNMKKEKQTIDDD
ncbi:MAG: hypothetical protein FWC53_01520 [Firmicutes bacterium]|nr:hypothetical protein [Bacillota bacterium]